MSKFFDAMDKIDLFGDSGCLSNGLDEVCDVLQEMQAPLSAWINSHPYADLPVVLYLLEMSAAGLRQVNPDFEPVAKSIANIFGVITYRKPKGGSGNEL